VAWLNGAPAGSTAVRQRAAAGAGVTSLTIWPLEAFHVNSSLLQLKERDVGYKVKHSPLFCSVCYSHLHASVTHAYAKTGLPGVLSQA
jgi:hypothetical protein